MDDPERDKFYSVPETPSDVEDDEELELEPPDESVDEHQRQAVRQAMHSRIDIDEIYREADRDRGGEILENWVRNFRFQFQIKHLLIATAALAIVLTLVKLHLFWATLVVSVMLFVAGLYAYLRWEDSKHQAEVARKREALYARRRAQLAAQMSGQAPDATEPALLDDVPQPSDATDAMWQASVKKEAFHFRFRFSLRELLMLMTAAAVTFGLIRILGGPAATESVLGLVALAGLIVFACGYEPPQNVVLGWWLILAMYVFISILTFVWGVLV